MNIDTFKNIFILILLVLVQGLLLNHIHLFGYATPLLAVYFILRFPRNNPKWANLLWSFTLGIGIDMFGNTPGLNTTSLTFIGMLQPYVLSIFLNRESAEDLKPSPSTLGWNKFLLYATILTLTYTFLLFTFEAFNFFNPIPWALSIVGSFILTIILIAATENLSSNLS